MEPLVLLYEIPKEMVGKLRFLCMKLDISAKTVPQDHYGVPIGAMAGVLPMPQELPEPVSISEKMLVLCGFDDKLLDAFLQNYRMDKIPPISLKAVLTPTNASWNAAQLQGELLRERSAVKNTDPLAHYLVGLGGRTPDQTELVTIFRQIQTDCGGTIPDTIPTQLAKRLNMKESYLRAILKRYPSLRLADTPNRLEVCGGPNCSKKGNQALLAHLFQRWGAVPGGASKEGKFSLSICPCQKRCGEGPCVRFNGTLYPRCTPEALDRLILGK